MAEIAANPSMDKVLLVERGLDRNGAFQTRKQGSRNKPGRFGFGFKKNLFSPIYTFLGLGYFPRQKRAKSYEN
ncbi:MAG TPA: hypothetical protein PKY12_13070, partial [Catalimonadaceae bacterium]|nr:hypothetical protein [Catalimonadaceae bacterium]